MYVCCPCPDLAGAFVEDGSSAASATPVTETGSLLTVQRCGPDPAHVCVCSTGSLDGLCLVRHRTQGDRKQWPCYLGHRWARCMWAFDSSHITDSRVYCSSSLIKRCWTISSVYPSNPSEPVLHICTHAWMPLDYFNIYIALSVQRKRRSQTTAIISPVMHYVIPNYVTYYTLHHLPKERGSSIERDWKKEIKKTQISQNTAHMSLTQPSSDLTHQAGFRSWESVWRHHTSTEPWGVLLCQAPISPLSTSPSVALPVLVLAMCVPIQTLRKSSPSVLCSWVVGLL